MPCWDLVHYGGRFLRRKIGYVEIFQMQDWKTKTHNFCLFPI